MRRFISTFAQSLRSDERGTALVELAMIAPVLALVTVGIVDFSQGFSRRAEITQGIHRTLEKSAASNFQFTAGEEGIDYSPLKTEVAQAARVDASEVTVTVWLECDGEEMPDYDMTCGVGEVTARYLQVTVETAFEPNFDWAVSSDSDGTFPLWAEAAVRIQ